MVGEGFLTTLKKSLDEGKVTEAEIGRDEALTVSVNLKTRATLMVKKWFSCILGMWCAVLPTKTKIERF